MKLPLIFAVLTALCWGMYGHAVAASRSALTSPFKPYVAIGAAYLVWGIAGGILGMLYKGDSFSFSGPGALWGFVGGSLGAWGAFTLTLAMFNGGTQAPHAVMTIVFGGAVTVAALYAVWRLWGHVSVSPMLWVGIGLVLVGAMLVAFYTPHEPSHAGKTRQSQATASPQH